MVNDKNYITVQGWMVKELGLKGNKLLTYALIYGFTQDGKSEFNGSLTYIADWVGVTKRAIIDILNDLMDKQLIAKVEHTIGNIKVYSYKVTSAENFTTSEKTSPGSEKTSPNNNIYNNIPPLNNNNKLLLLSPQGEKKPYGESQFVFLTDTEYAKVKELYGEFLNDAINTLDSYIASNPKKLAKKYSSHFAVLRKNNWVYKEIFGKRNQPLASNEDLTAFVKIWNTFVARTTEDIANIRLNYAFTPKVKAVTESDVRTMIPGAKSVLSSLMGSLPQKIGSPAITGWSGYDQGDQWRFATSMLYIRWRNSKFLRDMPVTASMFLKHIDKIADPYNDCYLDR